MRFDKGCLIARVPLYLMFFCGDVVFTCNSYQFSYCLCGYLFIFVLHLGLRACKSDFCYCFSTWQIEVWLFSARVWLLAPSICLDDNVVQRSLGYMVNVLVVSPVLDISVRSNCLNYYSLPGLAQSQDEEYLIARGYL